MVEFREVWSLTKEYVARHLNTCRFCGAPITNGVYHMWQNHTSIHIRLRCDKPEEECHYEWVEIPLTALYKLVPQETETPTHTPEVIELVKPENQIHV